MLCRGNISNEIAQWTFMFPRNDLFDYKHTLEGVIQNNLSMQCSYMPNIHVPKAMPRVLSFWYIPSFAVWWHIRALWYVNIYSNL